jgi:hypothetical protein
MRKVTAAIFVVLASLAAPAAFFLIVFALDAARGQEHHHARDGHAQFHANYQGWINQAGQGCCNNQDCAPLADADERTSRGFLEVRVEGQWCPILSKHYLRKGNVPDASTAHVCAWLPGAQPGGPCERLLCYQPKPGI